MPAPTLLAQTSAEIDVSPADQARSAVDNMLAGFFSALPRLGTALVILTLFWIVARLVRGPLRRRLTEQRSMSFGRVFSTLAYVGIVLLGVVIAVPVAAPSVDVLSVFGGLGLLGVAAGFAFQDILSNLLAGILLLIRDPFRAGDQIEVKGILGTVQMITIRETQITTYGGRLVYIPNADVYTNAITVQTAEEVVRTSLIVGVGYDADLSRARAVALDTLATVDGVVDVPAPEAYYTEFGASSIHLDLRYWTSSRQADIRRIQGDVVQAVKAAFDDANIDIPFDIVTLDTMPSFDRAIRQVSSVGSVPSSASESEVDEPLEELTRGELYARAQEAGIEGRSKMSKHELAEALRQRD